MASKIVRTVIGGHAIETPVQIPDIDVPVKETAKPKRGRKKSEKVAPVSAEAPVKAAESLPDDQ